MGAKLQQCAVRRKTMFHSRCAAGVRAGDKRSRSQFQAAHMDHSMDGSRPQDSFDPPPDNSNTPFKPHLAHWQDFLVQPCLCTLQKRCCFSHCCRALQAIEL